MDSEPVDPEAPPLRGPVLMGQSWLDLAAVHWAVEPSLVQQWMPPGVRPDTVDGGHYTGRSFVGLLAFRMVRAGVGRGPAVPWLGTFLETNVRLYSVDKTGRRGVVFLSLDASRLPVVLGARAVFRLPYRWSRMRYGREGVSGVAGTVHDYGTRTRWPKPPGVTSRLVVREQGPLPPSGPPRELADFVSARWGLHLATAGRTWYIPNRHDAWPLYEASLLELDDALVTTAGFPGLTAQPPDLVTFSTGVRTVFGLPGSAQRPRRSPSSPAADTPGRARP